MAAVQSRWLPPHPNPEAWKRGAGPPARWAPGSAVLCLACVCSAALCRRPRPLAGRRPSHGAWGRGGREGGGEGGGSFSPAPGLLFAKLPEDPAGQSWTNTEHPQPQKSQICKHPPPPTAFLPLIDSAAKCKLHRERAAGGLGPQISDQTNLPVRQHSWAAIALLDRGPCLPEHPAPWPGGCGGPDSRQTGTPGPVPQPPASSCGV